MLLRKHSKKSVLRSGIAAMLALVCIVASFAASTASAETKYQEGDVVLFGSYEQNNIRSDGAEPIEWIVLDVQPDRILLLSATTTARKA